MFYIQYGSLYTLHFINEGWVFTIQENAKGVTRQNSKGLFYDFMFIETNNFLEKV